MILYNALISLNRKCIVIDIEVPIKEERIQPLALGMIHYVIVFINLYKLNRLLLVQGLMLCYEYWINPVDQKIFKDLNPCDWNHGITNHVMDNGFHSLFTILCSLIVVSISRIILNSFIIVQVASGFMIYVISTNIQFHLFFN